MTPASLSESEWLARCFEGLTVELEVRTPSRWAEEKRYLPPSVTSLPGYYRFEIAPYLREIVDCLSIDNPVREVSVMKGVQLGFTVGVLENAIGYFMEHVRTAPVMLVTADAELAKLRMESYITPMIQYSGLSHLIKSADETNTRKKGKTDSKIEWYGGGFLVPFGAQNANKLRSISIQVLLRDEIDGWPDVVGADGDPIRLSTDRTAAYESSRKIADISTPLIKGISKIANRFALGDQRRYFVRCLKCGFAQVLRWRHINPDTGEVTGMAWDTTEGRLDLESVRYRCQECGHPHTNDDKTRLLADNNAEWRPTATPATPHHRSYHISALYSPPGMQTWGTCVQKWLEAWDEEANHPRDMGALQVFYNNVLGEPFEIRGEKVRFETVSEHRRLGVYQYGQIPNRFAVEFCESPVLLLTAAVDVHKEALLVGVFGWCRGGRTILVDYFRLEGDTEQLDDPGTWSKLRHLIETKEYVADDGKRYRVQATLIDSGYRADTIYRFAAEYVSGVYPVKGRDAPPKAAAIKEFSEFTTPMGFVGYSITVDLYKDRWSAALRRSWDGINIQPDGHFNAPMDATDKQLKELTVEVKRERIESRTGRRIGWEWHRPSGAANELWDVLIYGSAALDMVAWHVCRGQEGMESVDWPFFWQLLTEQALFYSPS